jgi:hypothetical protein
MAQTQLTVPVRDGYNFGVGADLLSGVALNKSVNNDIINSVDHAGGATVNFIVQRILTTSDLEDALGISADASYGSPSFGFGVSARFDFAKKCKIQSSSLFMTVTATVKLKVLSIDAPSLTSVASALVDRPDIFAQTFGNVFVRSMERGGIYVGVLRVDTSSSDESESVDSELKGSYGLFSADAEVKFSQVEKDFSADVFVQLYHEGGPVDLGITDPTDPSELLRNANKFLESFVSRPEDVAVPFLATLAPVSIATGPLPPNQSDLGHAQDVMRFCATRRSALLDQLNLLQLIVDQPPRYDFSNGSSLQEVATAAANTQIDLDLVASCASAAIDSPAGAKLPKDFALARGQLFPAAVMPAIMPIGRTRPGVLQTGSPPLDSITAFILQFEYPQQLPQIKADLPHSTPQVQSDVALGVAFDVAIAQATADGGLAGSPVSVLVKIGDLASPIQQRSTAKFLKLTADQIVALGLTNLPDATPAAVNAGLGAALSKGITLRQSMQELGQDVSKITFN